jgi:enterochelin esterase-like enzyme
VRPIERRTLLGCLLAAGLGCGRRTEERGHASSAASAPIPLPKPVPSADISYEEPSFDSSPVGPEKAVVIVPRWGKPGERFPVLVALHGRGEAVRGLDAGARGWLRDYGIDRTIARLRSPPLTRDDFMGFVDEGRLARINASLAERPFRGLVVACPWVPDVLSDRHRNNLDAAMPFGDFVVQKLLPSVVSGAPALADRSATGIDGVSLGGRVALQVGLSHPDRFGAVGTLQPAIQDAEAQEWSRRAGRAIADAGSTYLRLLTSDRDYFRAAIETLHMALQDARVPHEHLVVVGPHDYVFNRGPGGIEMLLWHDRVLRGEKPV